MLILVDEYFHYIAAIIKQDLVKTMMNIFAKQRVTYRTTLPKNELLMLLDGNIEKGFLFPNLGRKASKKPYNGGWGENGFFIKRTTNYRSSFLPEIKGKIKEDGNGIIIIDVEISVPISVKIFMGIWLGFVVLFMTLMMITAKEDIPVVPLLIPIFMLIFGYVMPCFIFWKEVNRSKNDLKNILQAEEVKSY